MAHFWTCQRTAAGVACKHVNPARKRNCERCGKPRPARKKKAHAVALELPYEYYVELNGGEFCKLCGHVRGPGEPRLTRDHDHVTFWPRGLLCFLCNRGLPRRTTSGRVDSAWLRRAADYVARTEGLEPFVLPESYLVGHDGADAGNTDGAGLAPSADARDLLR